MQDTGAQVLAAEAAAGRRCEVRAQLVCSRQQPVPAGSSSASPRPRLAPGLHPAPQESHKLLSVEKTFQVAQPKQRSCFPPRPRRRWAVRDSERTALENGSREQP